MIEKGSLTHNRCYPENGAQKGDLIMSPRSKREYIKAIFLRYRKAPHKEKPIILDEFCATCRYHRKHAIRLLRRFKRFIKPKTKKRGRATTKPGTLLRKHIPIKTNQWDESRPGFLEADTVAHCGELPIRACSPIPLTASTLPRAGVNKEPFGEKGKPPSWNKSKKNRFI